MWANKTCQVLIFTLLCVLSRSTLRWILHRNACILLEYRIAAQAISVLSAGTTLLSSIFARVNLQAGSACRAQDMT